MVKDDKGKESRKLIGTTCANNLWIPNPLFKWYVQHGLFVDKIHTTIFYEAGTVCFDWFVDYFVNERRKGDEKPEYAIKAAGAKLVLNSSYGKTITNFEKHIDIKIVADKNIPRYVRKNNYQRLTPLSKMCEMEFSKKKYRQGLPFQIGLMVYGYAKLRMLQFYYNFLDKFIPREYFQLQWMDTDSFYMALAGKNLDDLVRPDLKDEYECVKQDWLVTNAYDERTPGLFKDEWIGSAMIALAPRMYFAVGEKKDKMSCKGSNKKQNVDILNYANFMKVYDNKDEDLTIETKNAGFRVYDSLLYRYTQEKKGLGFRQDKRKLLPDNRQTEPLF